jgi:Kef-type K+ transport system membrane component KefB
MEIFIEISIILIVTTGIATLARMLKQPLVVGYLLSGVIVGPYFLNILKSNDEVALFSQVGIAMLLFIVGLSLNPATVKETGKASLITGLGQIIFTSVIGFFLMKFLGYSNVVSMYGSIALAFSSTIIILKLLSDRGDLNSLYGKVSIGFLLVQDVVATILLIVVPLVGSHNASGGDIGMEFFRLFISGTVVSVGLYLIAKYILPKFSDYLACSSELLFLFSVSWGLVLATVFYKIGFSIEIGALIAGVTLSASKYSFEISSRMRPLRDFFVVMFFVLLGSHLVLSQIGTLFYPALVLSLFVLFGNPLIVFILMNVLGYSKKTSFMAGLTVAQISEFSLILMALGLSLGHFDQSAVTLITLVGIITITGSTYFVIYADFFYRRVGKFLDLISFNKKESNENHHASAGYDMYIIGYGRVGSEFIEKAKTEHLNYVIVDYNPEVFAKGKDKDINSCFGDIEDVEFLEEIGISAAKIIVSTAPDTNANILLLKHYRKTNKDGVFIAMAHTVDEANDLYKEGATYAVLPHYLGAYHAAQMISDFSHNKEIFAQCREYQSKQIERLQVS